MIKEKIRTIYVILLVAVGISMSMAAWAIDMQAEKLRVGFFELAGYHERDSTGLRCGYGYDFLTLLKRYSNYTFDYVGFDKTLVETQQMLLDGEIDLVTSVKKTPSNERLFDFSLPIGGDEVYVIVRKGNQQLLNNINHSIAQMDAAEGDWRTQLMANNSGSQGQRGVVFSDEEQDFIAHHNTPKTALRVITDNNWSPFSELAGSVYRGIVPEYFELLMRMSGMKYEFVNIGSDVHDAESARIKEGKGDIYLCCTGDLRVIEHDGYLPTTPVMSLSAAFLRRRGVDEILTIAICETTPYLNGQMHLNEQQETRLYKDSESAIQAVLEGEADAAYLYAYDAQRRDNYDYTNVLVYEAVPGSSVNLYAVIPDGNDHRLVSILSKCTRKLSAHELETISSRKLSAKGDNLSLTDYISLHPRLAVSLMATVMLLLFLGIGTWLKHKSDQKARALAEQANQAKTSFLFNMSHDIRTPMNAIIGFRRLLEKYQDDPVRRADYLNKIDNASRVLLSIINNVLEMARIDKGTVELDETAWSFAQFEDAVNSIFQGMMDQKGITFTHQINAQHQVMYCDPTKLREVYYNLLSNAYKYTPEGGKVSLLIEELPCQREGYATMRATIADTGIGMSEDFLPHLFEEFSRESNVAGSKIEGTGLGMPIVKRLVDLMGGTIEVQSQKGVGTTFVVTLTHRIAPEEELREHAEVVFDPAFFEGKRVLLAEDSDLNAEIAIDFLNELGLTVDRAEDGQRAVEMVEQAEAGYYNMILMDIRMPRMDGYEATMAIRVLNDHVKAGIPIVAMTANAFEEDKRNARKAGMNGHVAKPIDPTALIKALARHCK